MDPVRALLDAAGQAIGRGDFDAAGRALRRAEAIDPAPAGAWRAIGDAWHAAGQSEPGGAAHLKAVQRSIHDPDLVAAAAALGRDALGEAEPILRARLKALPTDVAAIRMLAELATRLQRYGDAETLLLRALDLAPGFLPARHNLAVVLYRQARSEAALDQVERLLAADPAHPGYRNLKAAILVRIGDYPQAIALYRGVLADLPEQPRVWMSLGHALKTVGQMPESIAAYRTSIAQLPSLGESWWSLANLKTFRFADADIAAIREQLARDDLGDEDRFHFDFALGKALEDRADYAASFAHYDAGNRRRRAGLAYDPDELTEQVARARALFSPDFFAARPGGDPAPDPIFVVGLQRSGSTLVEQILSSHPLIEGTMELPDLTGIVRQLAGRRLRGEGSYYPEVLAELTPDARAALGREYLALTRIQRKTDRPFFIDKLPNNFAHAGLIHLILPNARIIDVRRHPMGCCFSCYKQHFARGQGFAYDLTELGRYYADYVAMMAVVDAALPGRVHRVIYERLVGDLEGEVRRLLAYVGVDFDPACLAFHQTDRAVRTPSAEQVRQPIYADAVEQWRHFAPWLGPLRDALGDVVDHYADAPEQHTKPS
ncbi:tetratricopeptide repeat-containing sulfotransferase family protein [Sphingomonas hengshuiensis]|uniref:tetratricopeptide repeat-containing sulfotransferase family protein n=1 Tax=Sphingomonas hengshuiensis TaxID=1609977 RepID=UPI00069743E6|nr:tetratricopeptide repeat-containing sulfotransferase family protein [Sphingomonas hengshuiensis]